MHLFPSPAGLSALVKLYVVFEIISSRRQKKIGRVEEQKKENPKIGAPLPSQLREHDYSSEQHSAKTFRLPVPFFLIGPMY
jgi:hypothetical protein